MAKKAKKTTLSAPRTTRKVKIKRRRTARRKGMLSEFFTPGTAAAAGKSVLSGALGGASALLIDKALPEQTDQTKALVKIGGGFVMAAIMKMPNVGAGMAGVGVYQLLAPTFGLSEGANYAAPIEALPMYLNENGEALSDNAGYLADAGQLAENVYPNYVPLTTY